MVKRIAISLTMLSFFCSQLYAGAWVQEKGHGLNILTLRQYISTKTWSSGGHLRGSPRYSKAEVDEYLEYGLTDKLTIGMYYSALKSYTSAGGVQGGSNDHVLLARYQLWKNDWRVLSIQVFADKLGRAAQFNIPPQNSSFNSGEAILFGTSGKFGKEPNQYWFFDILTGLVQRYSAGNQLQINLEGGWKFQDNKVWLLLQNYNTFSLDHLSYPQGVGYNLVTVAPSLMYWFTKAVGFQFGIAQDIYGQNVGKGTSPFIASWFQF